MNLFILLHTLTNSFILLSQINSIPLCTQSKHLIASFPLTDLSCILSAVRRERTQAMHITTADAIAKVAAKPLTYGPHTGTPGRQDTEWPSTAAHRPAHSAVHISCKCSLFLHSSLDIFSDLSQKWQKSHKERKTAVIQGGECYIPF